jgi:hypothetical protein
MILFHSFLFHCGSAVPDNTREKSAQQRLFAYVNTEFLDTNKTKYKQLKNKNRGSDIPIPEEVQHDPLKFCCKQTSDKWLCDDCDKEKVRLREKITNYTETTEYYTKTTEWDKMVPGSVVAGNMKKLGYVIVRTSLTKLECPYLLATESAMSGWQNISSKGKQPCVANCKRQQFALEECSNKAISGVFDIPFYKLQDDILKIDPSLSRSGYWTQVLLHKKMLRNMGPCPKQYPHADYDFATVRGLRKQGSSKRKDGNNTSKNKTKNK